MIMKKQTKLVAVLSTAALMSLGASMISFAASGWVEEDGAWVFYNRDKEKATEEWKKSGNNWFWLDDNGQMATDQLVEDDDDYYYVNEAGAMVTNQWVSIENENSGEEGEPDHYWYYFQANGKAYKRSSSASDSSVSAKTINGKKYAFDDEGRMLFGWVSGGERQSDDDAWKECDYYFGGQDDGAMSLGWQQIHIVDDEYADLQPGDEYWGEEQDRWFYFQTSGKKITVDSGTDDTLKTKTINGKKYGFDEYGRMISGWFTDAASFNNATQGVSTYSSSFMYFNNPESGARYTKSWFKVVPGYYLDESKYNDGEENWYYADGSGNIYSNEIRNIKGKKYAFDEYGRMVNGLVFLEMKDEDGRISSTYISQVIDDDNYDTEEEFDDFAADHMSEINSGLYRCFYFGNTDDGSMKTGKQTVTIDGDSFTFNFKDSSSLKGAAIHGMDDHKLYMAGKLIKADSDDKYQIVIYKTVTDENAGKVITMEKMDTEDFLDTYCTEKSTDKETIWTVNPRDKAENTKFYLVNTSGAMVKTKSAAKDGEDYKFSVSNYEITKVVLDQ